MDIARYHDALERAAAMVSRGMRPCDAATLCEFGHGFRNEIPPVVHVYGLVCPYTLSIVYVGSSGSPWSRYLSHRNLFASAGMREIIERLDSRGIYLLLKMIGVCHDRERDEFENGWIRAVGKAGHPLRNRGITVDKSCVFPKVSGMEQDRMLTAAEAAKILNRTTRWVQQLASEGKIGEVFGNQWMFTRSEILHLKENRRKRGRPKLGREYKLRLGEDDLDLIKQAAEADGKKPAEWMREVLVRTAKRRL